MLFGKEALIRRLKCRVVSRQLNEIRFPLGHGVQLGLVVGDNRAQSMLLLLLVRELSIDVLHLLLQIPDPLLPNSFGRRKILEALRRRFRPVALFVLQFGFKIADRPLHRLDVRMIGLEARLQGLKTLPCHLKPLCRRFSGEPIRSGCRWLKDDWCRLGLQIRDLAFEQRPPLRRPIGRVREILQLNLCVLNRLEIAGGLCRQLAAITTAILLELLFVLYQSTFRILKLRLEKLVRVFCHVLSVAEVLLDKQRRKPFRGFLGRSGLLADIRNPERLFSFRLDRDVVAHALHDVFHRELALQFFVEIEIPDDPLQSRAAHNLVLQRVQPIFDLRGDGRRGPNVGVRDSLRDEHDQRF